MPRVTFYILSLFLVLGNCLHAQKLEVGLFAGGANYIGDLAPDLKIMETRPAVGVNFKKIWNPYFAGSINVLYGEISGNDSNFSQLAPRGLHFRSSVLEISPQIEFNFFRFGGVGVRTSRYTPYAFAGIGWFRFNPRGKYNNEWYELQPLHTEGQELYDGAPSAYKLWSISVPMGLGLKVNLSDKWNLLINCGYRATFTDYMDDVKSTYPDFGFLEEKQGKVAVHFSDPTRDQNGNGIGRIGFQRGNPDIRDWYIFTGVTLSYIITQSRCYTF